jgi:hypothetical protein
MQTAPVSHRKIELPYGRSRLLVGRFDTCISQDNCLNCVGVRSEPVRPGSCVAATVEVGASARFSARMKQGGRRRPRSRMQIALRAKRFEPYSVVLTCFLSR